MSCDRMQPDHVTLFGIYIITLIQKKSWASLLLACFCCAQLCLSVLGCPAVVGCSALLSCGRLRSALVGCSGLWSAVKMPNEIQ